MVAFSATSARTRGLPTMSSVRSHRPVVKDRIDQRSDRQSAHARITFDKFHVIAHASLGVVIERRAATSR